MFQKILIAVLLILVHISVQAQQKFENAPVEVDPRFVGDSSV